MTSEKITFERAIKRNFSKIILARGEALFKLGNVSELHRLDGYAVGWEGYEAKVIGSRGNAYDVSLEFFNGGIVADCDCAYGYDCKHAAAVALAVLDLSGESREPGEPVKRALAVKLDPQAVLNNWLGALKASGGSAVNASARAPATQDWSLYYLIDTQNPTQISLIPVLRYRKKSGEWGRLEQLPSHRMANLKNLNQHDKALASLLRYLPERAYRIPGYHYLPGYPLDEATGFLLLQHALRSGRALDQHNFAPLQEAQTHQLTMDWEAVDGGQVLAPQLQPEIADDWQILATSPLSYRVGNAIGRIDTRLEMETLALLLTMPPVPEQQFQSVCLELAKWVGAESVVLPESIVNIPVVNDFIPKATLLGVYSADSGYLPALRLSAVYGDWEQMMVYPEVRDKRNQPDEEILVECDGNHLKVIRRYAREFQLTEALRNANLGSYDYKGAEGEVWVPLEVNPERHLLAWHKSLPALEALFNDQAWQVAVDPSYQIRRQSVTVSGEASNHAGGWFDLSLSIDIGGVVLETSTLMSQWLAAGTPPVLPLQNQDQQWSMVDMAPLQPLLNLLMELYSGGQLDQPARLPAFKVMELESAETLNIKQPPSLKKLRQTLKNFSGMEPVTPDKKLQANLRDYQLHGLSWLMFLRNYGFGGILADDMGLGKTLQALAFVQKLKATRKLVKGALVVAPTSLIWNWLAEAQKFTPNLSCLMLHGTERKTRFDEIPGHDLVITSYGLIQRDLEVYQEYHFDLVILDEAQNIKNTQAKTTAMVKQLSADMRLCLTGTPLENHLGELWSLMDFALPGLLGKSEHFRRHFRQEIEQNGNSARGQQLSARIAPFMLRRTKSEVVLELPPKTEILQRVELAKDQKTLYESIRVSMEKRVRDLIKAKGVARSHIEFLDALLKLRQACIDPRLVKLELAKKVKTSAKMAWMVENLPEMVAEGRKILVFSQFTEMLALIETEMHNLNIPCVKLTGQTRKRQEVIEAFQQTATPVFLISLKAGGSGLNLTAADTVIHVDPWWNPAVENQATDRAYRIGQDKPVFVYKLVANGTVEEKIQALQQKKQDLADSLFNATSKISMPSNGEELLSLFSLG